jgi:4-amino-4-deoxy-L-arabinose transferase-like glycosyltransferase
MLKSKFISFVDLCSLFVVSGVIFLCGLGSYGLLDNNEGLYAQIAREMLLSGDYIIPTLNGGIYIEKPPLLYWLIALSFKIFGVHEFSARLVPALAGMLTVWTVYFLGSRLLSRCHGFYGALVLCASIGFMIFSRMVFFDVLLTFLLTLGLLLYALWWKTASRWALLGFYVSMAFAVLTKGGVALVLVGLTLLAFWGMERPGWRKVLATFNPLGIIVFLSLTVPWHVIAALREQDFLRFYFINEHVYRFLDIREPRDYYRGPVYYYFHRVMIYLVPLLPIGVASLFQKKQVDSEISIRRMLILWVLTFFFFFSLSKAKANYYCVTLMPALALYVAFYLVEIEKTKPRFARALLILSASLIPLIFIFLGIATPYLRPPYNTLLNGIDIMVLLMLGAPVIALFGGVMYYGVRALKRSVMLIAAQTAVLSVLAIYLIQGQEAQFSSKTVAQALPPSTPSVYFYRDYEKMSSIRFYLDQEVVLIDSQSNDLDYAKKTNRSPLFMTSAAFKNHYSKGACVFVFHEQQKHFEGTFKEFKRLSLSGGKNSSRVGVYCF